MRWLADELGIQGKQMIDSINKYWENMFSETRGQQKLSSRQAVYDIWLKNSIPSNDERNSPNQITISKRKFLPHADLNKEVVVEEKINKRGKKVMTANKFTATLIVHAIHKKLRLNNIDVSIGTIISLKPFFVNYPTKKGMALVLVQNMSKYKITLRSCHERREKTRWCAILIHQ